MQTLKGRGLCSPTDQTGQRPRVPRCAGDAAPRAHSAPVPTGPRRALPSRRARPPAAAAPATAPLPAAVAAVAAAAARGPGQVVCERMAIDIALPVVEILVAFKALDMFTSRMRQGINARLASEGSLMAELQNRNTLCGLLLLSLRTPSYYMLPPLLIAHILRSALNIVDLALSLQVDLPCWAVSALKALSPHMVTLDALLASVLSSSAAIFAAWFFIQFKDTLVSEAILVRAIRRGHTELERVLLPLSTLLTWAVVLGTAVGLLQQTFGLNLKPLLALGGAGGIAAGFASQQVLQNLVSGVNIFLSRPFVVGEQVVLSGDREISGVVESVDVMRTQLRTGQGVVVVLPNKMVADMVIYNRSRSTIEAAHTHHPRPAVAGAAVIAPVQRVLTFLVKVKRDQEHAVDEIRSQITKCLGDLIELERAAAAASFLESRPASPGPGAQQGDAKRGEEGSPAAAAVAAAADAAASAADALLKAPAAAMAAVAHQVGLESHPPSPGPGVQGDAKQQGEGRGGDEASPAAAAVAAAADAAASAADALLKAPAAAMAAVAHQVGLESHPPSPGPGVQGDAKQQGEGRGGDEASPAAAAVAAAADAAASAADALLKAPAAAMAAVAHQVGLESHPPSPGPGVQGDAKQQGEGRGGDEASPAAAAVAAAADAAASAADALLKAPAAAMAAVAHQMGASQSDGEEPGRRGSNRGAQHSGRHRQEQNGHTGGVGDKEGGEGGEDEAAAPRPPPVAVSLARLTEHQVELFVKAELLLVVKAPADADRKVEAALMKVSKLVQSEFGGLVVTDAAI